MSPGALIISGYGLNCEDETLLAFEKAGATGRIIHINDLIQNPNLLKEFQILAIPGGFSYGDDTGSGNALANRIQNNLQYEVQEFFEKDSLILGICNGCQVLVNLGIVPVTKGEFGERSVAMLHNTTDRYQCRWVDVKTPESHCIWTKDIEYMHIPIAHGEGDFAISAEHLAEIEEQKLIAMTYVLPDGSPANGVFPANPNGSKKDIAALTDPTGRVIAMMPHPERGIFTSQRDDFPELKDAARREGKKLPEYSDGLRLFQNAVTYYE